MEMHQTSRVERNLLPCLYGMGMVLLILPVILWLLGWVMWWLALPISAGLVWGVVACFRHLPRDGTLAVRLTRGHVGIGLLVVLACGLFVFMGGYGGWFEQHIDFWLRNAFYGNLMSYDWPLVLPNGNWVAYHFAGWLPAALACKLVGIEWGDYVMWCWNWLVLSVALLIAVHHVRRKWWLLLVLFFFWQYEPMALCKQLCTIAGLLSEQCFYDGYAPIFISPQIAINTTNHHGALTILALVLTLCTQGITLRGLALVGCGLAVVNPMAAVAWLPFALLRVWQSVRVGCRVIRVKSLARQVLSVEVLCGVVVALLGGAYFSTAPQDELFMIVSTWCIPVQLWEYAIFVLPIVFVLGVSCLWCLPAQRRNAMFYLALVLVVVSASLHVGVMRNEWTLKASVVPLTVLWILAVQSLDFKRWNVGGVSMVLLLLSQLGCGVWTQAVRKWGSCAFLHPERRQQNTLDMYQGHLFHPQISFTSPLEYNQNEGGTKALPPPPYSRKDNPACAHLPWGDVLFYNLGGESAHTVFAWLPIEVGGRYNLPLDMTNHQRWSSVLYEAKPSTHNTLGRYQLKRLEQIREEKK